jgi:DNA ligase-associated metallophosphoesterase
MMHIRWGGEDLCLLAEKAVLWKRRRTLLIADPHFGKAAAFRDAGIPVPGGMTRTDLGRLDRLIGQTEVRRLVILGDFLHARAGRSLEVTAALADWRRRHSGVEVLLVRGNHDIHAGDPPQEWRITVAGEPLADPPFLFCHEPAGRRGGLVMGGHVHPAGVLEGPGGEWLRAPCFCFGADRAVVPAFGSFTGCKAIRPGPGERVFVVGEGEVVEAAVGR